MLLALHLSVVSQFPRYICFILNSCVPSILYTERLSMVFAEIFFLIIFNNDSEEEENNNIFYLYSALSNTHTHIAIELKHAQIIKPSNTKNSRKKHINK